MTSVTAYAILRSTPERIFRYLDPEQVGRWYGTDAKTSIEKLSPEPYGQGTRMRMSQTIRGQKRDFNVEVVEFEPNVKVVWSVTAGRFQGRVAFAIKPGERERRTEFSLTEEYRIGDPISRFFYNLLMKPTTERRLYRYLKTLKELVEGT